MSKKLEQLPHYQQYLAMAKNKQNLEGAKAYEKDSDGKTKVYMGELICRVSGCYTNFQKHDSLVKHLRSDHGFIVEKFKGQGKKEQTDQAKEFFQETMTNHRVELAQKATSEAADITNKTTPKKIAKAPRRKTAARTAASRRSTRANRNAEEDVDDDDLLFSYADNDIDDSRSRDGSTASEPSPLKRLSTKFKPRMNKKHNRPRVTFILPDRSASSTPNLIRTHSEGTFDTSAIQSLSLPSILDQYQAELDSQFNSTTNHIANSVDRRPVPRSKSGKINFGAAISMLRRSSIPSPCSECIRNAKTSDFWAGCQNTQFFSDIIDTDLR